MSNQDLWKLGYRTLQELETDQGILASGRNEIFGCIFGRDSLITSLEILRAYEYTKDPYFLALTEKILRNLLTLQGRTLNIESGEEPGKCIHEFRPTNHEHLTRRPERPWFVYPDNRMRNYDTVDATPLLLIALHRYYEISGNTAFMGEALPHVHAALQWISMYGDSNGDGFIDYRIHPQRKYGGLVTQSWMDSAESLFHLSGEPVVYPVAPVEVQAYTYLALRSWADFFADDAIVSITGESQKDLAADLAARALALKMRFNDHFAVEDASGMVMGLAFAIDGEGKQLAAPRSSMGHCLWATRIDRNGERDGILDFDRVSGLVSRLLSPDLFEPEAGIRTLSASAPYFDPGSYHNGSIWPHDTAIIIEGMENFGYREEASRVRKALFSAYRHFKTPLELFVFANGAYDEYRSPEGQTACRKQAWSAGALLMEGLRGE